MVAQIMVEPVKVKSLHDFGVESRKENTRVYAAFVDNAGVIHALDSDLYGFRFRPIAASYKAQIMFESNTIEDVVEQALKSGYRVFQFDSIEEMVIYLTTA